MRIENLNIDVEGLSIAMNDILNFSTVLRSRGELDKSGVILDSLKIILEMREEVCSVQLKSIRAKSKKLEAKLLC